MGIIYEKMYSIGDRKYTAKKSGTFTYPLIPPNGFSFTLIFTRSC